MNSPILKNSKNILEAATLAGVGLNLKQTITLKELSSYLRNELKRINGRLSVRLKIIQIRNNYLNTRVYLKINYIDEE